MFIDLFTECILNKLSLKKRKEYWSPAKQRLPCDACLLIGLFSIFEINFTWLDLTRFENEFKFCTPEDSLTIYIELLLVILFCWFANVDPQLTIANSQQSFLRKFPTDLRSTWSIWEMKRKTSFVNQTWSSAENLSGSWLMIINSFLTSHFNMVSLIVTFYKPNNKASVKEMLITLGTNAQTKSHLYP